MDVLCEVCGVKLTLTRSTYGTRGEAPSAAKWTHMDGPQWRKVRREVGGHVPQTSVIAGRSK